VKKCINNLKNKVYSSVITAKKGKKCSILVKKCVLKSHSAKISKPRYVSATRKIIYKNSTTKVSRLNAICVKCSELIILGHYNTKYSKQIISILKSYKKLIKCNINLKQNETQDEKTKIDYTVNPHKNPKPKKSNKTKNRYYQHLKLLLSNDIEQNPGPQNNPLELQNPKNQVIFTYNLQGCKDFKKLKRVMNYFNKQKCSSNCIINLQETHLENINKLPYHWKKGNIQSIARGNSGGVAILFNESYFDEIINSHSDKNGRFCSFTALKNEETYIYLNVYALNDHYKSFEFFNEVETWLTDMYRKHPSANIIISGDFNFIFDPTKDSIGRNNKAQEQKLANHTIRLMTRLNLIDAYREKHKWGGFTWGRNNPTYMRSRLDHILVSKKIQDNIIQAYTTKTPYESDHSLVYIELDMQETQYGPGIKRCNSDLLNTESVNIRVKSELSNIANEIPKHWNPHQKLDYMKMHTRNILIKIGKEKAKETKSALEYNNAELQLLNDKLDKTLIELQKNKTVCSKSNLKTVDRLKEAIEQIEIENQDLKEQHSKRLIFRSRAKWAEEGEKSNKYFLNLLKHRQSKMIIRKLVSNGITHTEQNEISKAITIFYKDLYKNKGETFKPTSEEFREICKDLPKLQESEKESLKKPITKQELFEALNTCKESAPGPDGITYDTYKKLWDIFGDLIYESWNHSVKIGILPTSQRDSVITLLEKKGKDKTKIENLRPISLSNCDIKICTKALAIRTNKITGSILSTTQTGYIPGKQITDNCRLLEEIIDLTNKEEIEAYIITLDAQKAFDSVDHDYLLEILKSYNFPTEFITWVKLIYTKLRANVMVNGFLSDIIEIQRSVKQGDALSCALFIIAIDPLLRLIEKDERIIPLDINRDPSKEPIYVKSATFADDITAICKTKEGIGYIIENYNKFSKITGIKLNLPKTEIMVLGKDRDKTQNFTIKNGETEFTLTNQQAIKVCGITFSTKSNVSYEDNVIKKIDKMMRQLNIWRQRNLTLQGKILIVKTFALSQLIYSIQCTHIRKKELTLIENKIYKFIWNIKQSSTKISGKIKREILKGTKENGGLNAPDISIINNAIKYKFLLRCDTNNHPIAKFIRQNILKGRLPNEIISLNNTYASDFIKTSISTHNTVHNKALDDIKNLISNKTQNLNTNYKLYIGNIKIDNAKYINKNQSNLTRKLKQHNIKTYNDLIYEKIHKNKPALWYEVMQIASSFPKEWRTLIATISQEDLSKATDMIPIKENIFKKPTNITTKDIRTTLTKKFYKSKEEVTLNLQLKHKINANPNMKNPFQTLKETTKEAQLLNVQYKIIHNIYPTMKHLYKWQIKSTPNCRCGEVETLKHAVAECIFARESLINFQNVIAQVTNINLTLNTENLIFGLSEKDITNYSPYIPAINTCLIILKRSLILQRETKATLSEGQIKNLIMAQVAKEKYNAKMTKKNNAFRMRWPDNLIQMKF
jgi:exonuclease III